MVAPTFANLPAIAGRGTGILLPLAKSLADLMVIHEAFERDWPMDRKAIISQLGAASEHLGVDLAAMVDLMTDESVRQLNAWIGSTTATLINLRGGITDAPLGDAERKQITDIIQEQWRLFALLDKELLGVRSDPGTTP